MADQNGGIVGAEVRGTVVDLEALITLVGTSVHTGLRKGTDAPSAHSLWKAIGDSDDAAWPDAAKYAIWALRSMGFDIVKVVD